MSTDEIAIFPLSNVVLFPGVQAPLHLFEPRYRQMAEHVLDGDRRIGMVVVPPEHAAEMHGDPAVYPIGCAGTIGHSQRLRDDRLLASRLRATHQLGHELDDALAQLGDPPLLGRFERVLQGLHLGDPVESVGGLRRLARDAEAGGSDQADGEATVPQPR